MIFIVVVVFSAAFSGFFSKKKDTDESNKIYTVVENPSVNGKDGLNLSELELKEYHTPTPIPPTAIPTIDIPTPTEGPTPTARPTRPPTPTPTEGPRKPYPTHPPYIPDPPEYIPGFFQTIINFFSNL